MNIDLLREDRRVAASLKLYLFDQLKNDLKLSSNELEPILQEYSDSL